MGVVGPSVKPGVLAGALVEAIVDLVLRALFEGIAALFRNKWLGAFVSLSLLAVAILSLVLYLQL